MDREPDGAIAVVLAGGGARGAYEIGALSVLLPELADRGERPTIFVGTSVGALTATWLAAHADATVDRLVDDALGIWPTIRFRDVLRPLITVGGSLRVGRYLLGATVGHGRLEALLDPEPLTDTVERLIPFGRLERNVAEGRVTAAVVATAAHTGRSVVFTATSGEVPGEDHRRGIEYVKTAALTGEHIRASAAIPTAFPPVHVSTAKPGWYVDGGTRMNTATKPALALGARRLVVIGLNGTDPDPAEEHDDERPDALSGAAHLVQGLLADPLAADIRTLASTNELLLAGAGEVDTTKSPVPYIFVAPRRRDAIGELAREVYQDHFTGPKSLVSGRDLALLGRLLSADRSDMHGELFSYLCFAKQLAEELTACGRADARTWLDGQHDDGPWRLRPLPDEPPAPRVTAQAAPAVSEPTRRPRTPGTATRTGGSS
jgi:NTE family protein